MNRSAKLKTLPSESTGCVTLSTTSASNHTMRSRHRRVDRPANATALIALPPVMRPLAPAPTRHRRVPPPIRRLRARRHRPTRPRHARQIAARIRKEQFYFRCKNAPMGRLLFLSTRFPKPGAQDILVRFMPSILQPEFAASKPSVLIDSRGQALVLLAGFLGWMFDGMEMGIFPLVARPALQQMQSLSGLLDENFVQRWMGIITAMFLLGAATG